MAYRYGERNQRVLFPQSIEEYVPADAPVRAYDAIIEAMDLEAMGFKIDPHKVGSPEYDPRAMLKLLVYGYSYGMRSSRKLERECHYNLSFIWLLGGLKPDHKTISEFRRKHKKALRQVIKQCARLCIEFDLIEGNVLFLDGSRLRANAAIKHSWTKKKAQQALSEIEQRVEALLSECEAVDQQEQDQGSLVHLKTELKDQQKLQSKIQGLLEQLETEPKPSVNTTDEDCTRVHSRQGSHAGYHGQIVVDDQHGLIVNSDVVSENNDSKQFTNQLAQAQAVLEAPCQTACADAGYCDYPTLDQVDHAQTDVIVPSHQQAAEKAAGPFDKSRFTYDAKKDCFICPEGHRLVCKGVDAKNRCRSYYAGSVCRRCRHFGHCTINRLHGRKVRLYDFEQLRTKLAQRYQEPEAQAIFARRKMRVEHPFGHLKRNLQAGHFLLRGLAGVRAEMSLLSSCFNIARMISLLGVAGLIEKVKG